MKLPDELKRYAEDFGAENERTPYIEAIVRHCVGICEENAKRIAAADKGSGRVGWAVSQANLEDAKSILHAFGLEAE